MSVTTLLSIASDVYGDRVALGRRDRGISFSQLAETAHGGARLLGESGAKSVVYIGVNGPAVPSLLFASATAGIPFVPLNYRLSGEGLAALIDQLDAPLVLADAERVDLARCATDRVLLSEEWLAAAATAAPVDDDGPADGPAVLLFTSGTTSTPKGVVLRHEQLVSYVLQTVELASAGEEESILVSVPPYHVAGIGSVLSNMYGGRRMVYLPDFEPDRWLSLVREDHITNAMVVPTMLARIVEQLEGAPAGTPTLRALAYGGARMPPVVLERAMAAFPDVDFVNAYGLTETSSTIAVLGPADHREALASADPACRARLGSAGRLVPGMEGQVRGPDGAVLPPGESGELWVRGAQVSGEYRGVGSVLDEEGWFATHDLAHFDDEGYLFIEGRADDTIIRGGENIAPAEIEEVLERHPGVRDVAVVGVPDEEWGQRIVAVVVADAGQPVDPEDVRAYVRSRLRGSRTPDDVLLVPELPYGPTGKLLRRELIRSVTENPSP
ncbi:MAG: class I adenylate-forming enzyme family protein [Acidimicrobiales bacterium]